MRKSSSRLINGSGQQKNGTKLLIFHVIQDNKRYNAFFLLSLQRSNLCLKNLLYGLHAKKTNILLLKILLRAYY